MYLGRIPQVGRVLCDPHMIHVSPHLMHAVEASSRYIQNTFMIHLEKKTIHAPIHARRNTSIPYTILTQYMLNTYTIHEPLAGVVGGIGVVGVAGVIGGSRGSSGTVRRG